MVTVCTTLCTTPKVTATVSGTPKSTVYWRQVLGTQTISNLLTGSTFQKCRLLRSKIHSRLHLRSPQNKQRHVTELTSNAEFCFHVTHVRCTLLRQRHRYNNAIMATRHREGVGGFPIFLNQNHIHTETRLAPLSGVKYAVSKRQQIIPDCTVPNLENKNTELYHQENLKLYTLHQLWAARLQYPCGLECAAIHHVFPYRREQAVRLQPITYSTAVNID